MTYEFWKKFFLPLTVGIAPEGGGSGDGEGNGGDGGEGDLGGGTGTGDDWTASLPDNVREWDEVKNSDSPDKFWDQISNQRSFLGQSIRVPSSDAGKEDWNQFYAKLNSKVPDLMPKPNPDDPDATAALYTSLGKPEKPEDYKPPEIDDKGVQLDMTPVEVLRGVAHKHNLTQRQFEGIVADMTEQNIQNAIQAKDTQSKDRQTLIDEWGHTYDSRVKAVDAFAKQTNAPEALKVAAANGQLDAASMKWLHSIVEKFGGDEGLNLNQDTSQTGVMTPGEAKARISEIFGNKEHAYWNRRDPAHEDALTRMLELQKLANPGIGTDINSLRSGALSAKH